MTSEAWALAVKQSSAALKFAVKATGGTGDEEEDEVKVKPGTVDVLYADRSAPASIYDPETTAQLVANTMLQPSQQASNITKNMNALKSIRVRNQEATNATKKVNCISSTVCTTLNYVQLLIHMFVCCTDPNACLWR